MAAVDAMRRVDLLLTNVIRDLGRSTAPAGVAAVVGNLRDARGLVRAAIVRTEAMR